MKPHKYMMIIERDEDNMLVGTIPALYACHSQAKTLPELMKRMKEVVQLCVSVEKNPLKPLEFVGLQELVA